MAGKRIMLVAGYLFLLLFPAATLAADAPIPWGAKLVRDDTAITGGEERKVRTYETATKARELLNYYLKEMPGRGYSIFMQGDSNAIFTKGEEMVFVVVPPVPEGKTLFMITTASLHPDSNLLNPQADCESIPGIPAYPGGRCLRSTRFKSGVARSVTYSTADTINTVINYYRMTMPQYMWKLASEIDVNDAMQEVLANQSQQGIDTKQARMALGFMAGARGLEFRNERGGFCHVQVMGNPLAVDSTAITITYEEKAQSR